MNVFQFGIGFIFQLGGLKRSN